jgi:hypothetical protein
MSVATMMSYALGDKTPVACVSGLSVAPFKTLSCGSRMGA